MAEALPPYSDVDVSDEPRKFYIGDNAKLHVLKVFNYVGLYYQNVEGFDDFDKPNSQRIEVHAGYKYDRHGLLSPLALDSRDALRVTMSSAHTAQRLSYVPKFWADQGCSLETPGQPSLDQFSIKCLAEFTNQVAGAELIPVKTAY